MYIGIDLVMSQKTEEQVGHYLFEGIDRVGRYDLEAKEDLQGDIVIYEGSEDAVEKASDELFQMNAVFLTGDSITDIIGEYSEEYDS
jgi:hypothetical protein